MAEVVRGKMRSVHLVAVTAALLAGTWGAAGARAQTTGGEAPVDVAAEAGLNEFSRSFSITVADFNRDTYDDFFYVRHDPQQNYQGLPIPAPSLYRGSAGSTFTDFNQAPPAPRQSFGDKDRHGCAAGDANLDGRLDLFCAASLNGGPSELSLQDADGTFRDVTYSAGLTRSTHSSYRSATFINANGDQRPDIYVTRHLDGATQWPSELWINRGTNSQGTPFFTKDTALGLGTTIGAIKDTKGCTQAVDYDGDGDQDLLVCGQLGFKLYQSSLSSGVAGFTDVTASVGVADVWKDAQIADLVGDGALDLVQIKKTVVKVRSGNGTDFKQLVYRRDLRSGENVAVGDFNGDGLEDIYVLQSCRTQTKQTDEADLVLLNNPVTGTFKAITLPPVTRGRGCGDDVEAIDYNHDGRDDFVVSNGDKRRAGPIQLWTYRA